MAEKRVRYFTDDPRWPYGNSSPFLQIEPAELAKNPEIRAAVFRTMTAQESVDADSNLTPCPRCHGCGEQYAGDPSTSCEVCGGHGCINPNLTQIGGSNG